MQKRHGATSREDRVQHERSFNYTIFLKIDWALFRELKLNLFLMAAYKTQHFLPAAYLSHFSADGKSGRRVSDIWCASAKGQTCASVESFCAADYFYSVDDAEKVEKEFGKLESFYGTLRNNFWKQRNPKNEREYFGLVIMMFDIHLRSAAYAKNPSDNYADYLMRTSGFRNDMLFGQRKRQSTEAEIIEHLRKNWRVRMVEAGFKRSFLTSDNPSLLFHASNSDLVQLVVMPVTPRFYAVAFDRRAFDFTSSSASKDDETYLNHLQLGHSIDCVFTAERISDAEVSALQSFFANRTMRTVSNVKDGWVANTHRTPKGKGFDFIEQRRQWSVWYWLKRISRRWK